MIILLPLEFDVDDVVDHHHLANASNNYNTNTIILIIVITLFNTISIPAKGMNICIERVTLGFFLFPFALLNTALISADDNPSKPRSFNANKPYRRGEG